MAQSVPTATWVPCLRRSLPLGWGFHHLDARDGDARFWLDSDRDGTQAVEVRLERDLRHHGQHGDRQRPGRHARGYERVRAGEPDLRRRAALPCSVGGCLSVVFQLDGDNPGEALALASQAVGVVSRDDLSAQVHEDSGGRIDLDPSRGEG